MEESKILHDPPLWRHFFLPSYTRDCALCPDKTDILYSSLFFYTCKICNGNVPVVEALFSSLIYEIYWFRITVFIESTLWSLRSPSWRTMYRISIGYDLRVELSSWSFQILSRTMYNLANEESSTSLVFRKYLEIYNFYKWSWYNFYNNSIGDGYTCSHRDVSNNQCKRYK